MEEQLDIKNKINEVKNKYQYTEPMTLEDFTDMIRPVFTTEGDIIEKSTHELNGGKSLFTKKPIDIMESPSLFKIQEDFKMLQNEYALMSIAYAFAIDKGISQESEYKKEISAKDITIEELKKMIVNQSSHVKVLMEGIKSQTMSIVVKDNLIAQQTKQIEALTTENQQLTTENAVQTTTIQQRNSTITNLTNANANLTTENIRLKAKSNVVQYQLHNDPFLNEEPTPQDCKANVSTKRVVYGEAVGVKTDRWKGFKHTVNWVDDDEIPNHNKKWLENNLKSRAYFGDNVQLTNLLEAHNDIVNGRGEPDSLRSVIFGLEDRTALMIAAKKGHTDCVQTLIDHNADVNYLDRNNKTALDYAHKFWKKHKNSNVRQPLWQNGAVPSSCCEVLPSGITPSK
jgi:hypothetical protein